MGSKIQLPGSKNFGYPGFRVPGYGKNRVPGSYFFRFSTALVIINTKLYFRSYISTLLKKAFLALKESKKLKKSLAKSLVLSIFP